MQIGRISRLVAGFVILAGTAAAQPGRAPANGGAAPVGYEGSKVITVTVSNQREYLAVMSLAEMPGNSMWTHSPGLGELDVQVAPANMPALLQLGLPMRVMIDDLKKKIDDERADIEARRMRRDISWFQNYHTLAEINAYMAQLAAASPQLVTGVNLGNSLEGRAINGIRISAPDLPGNPRTSRPQLLFNGCQHAREWVGPATVMYIADQFISGYAGDPRIHAILDNAEILIVPVVNPDGYEYTWTPNNRLWRKNRRNNGDGSFGVDNNRNWGYQWGGQGASTSTSNETYRGTGPFSEPETQRLRDFMLANTRLRASIDFHSYSQLILSPWGWTNALPPDAAVFDQINSTLASTIQSVHGKVYTAGPTYTTIYPASGGALDWAYGAGSTPYKILGYSIELRDTGANGFILPASEIIPTGEENFAAVLKLSEVVAFPVTFDFPDGLPATAEAGLATTIRVGVTASPGNTLNASSPTLLWRAAGQASFTTSVMTPSGQYYTATLPAGTCGTDLQYYFQASSTDGRTAVSPTGAPATLYTVIPRQTTVMLDDACEAVNGWTVGAAGDNATVGMWENAVPQTTNAQSGSDHSATGTKCWVTDSRAGSSVGQYDLDGGTTTLTSPTFSAQAPVGHSGAEAFVSYWRWYSNDKGSNANTNSMPVLISNDNGATWQTLETVTENAGAWVGKTFKINDVIAPTATMKLRFQARDLTGAVVEAGVDDVKVTVVSCPCRPVDFNCDGFVNGDDFDQFVFAFYWGDPAADYDGNGFVNGDDFDSFVLAFEQG